MRPSLMCFCLLLPLHALAQAVPEAGLSITPSVEMRYDSNLFRQPGGTLAPGLSRDDFVITPQLQIAATLPVSLQTISLEAYTAYRIYTRNSAFDAALGGAKLRWDWQVGQRCKGDLGGGYARTPAGFEDARLTRRSYQDDISAGASGQCSIGANWALKLEGDYRDKSNDSAARSINDIEQIAGAATLSWSRDASFKPYVTGRYRHREQPNLSVLQGLPVDASANIWEGGAGLDWQPGDTLTLKLLLLATHVDDSLAGNRGTDASWLGELNYAPSPKLKLKLATYRRNDSNADFGALAFRLTGVEAQADWEATPLISASPRFSYQWRAINRLIFPAGTDSALISAQEDRTADLGLDLRYGLGERWRVLAEVGQQWRRGAPTQLDFDDTRALLRLSYEWR